MNDVRALSALVILGLAPIACTRPAATEVPPFHPATSEPANAVPTADPAIAFTKATGEALPRDPTADEMRDGQHIAYILAFVPGSPARLALNPAVWFGEHEADAASIADGNTNELHELSNGYYVRDLDPATVTMPVSPTSVVSLIMLPDKGHDVFSWTRVAVPDFAGWFAGTPIKPPAGRTWFGPWSDLVPTSEDAELMLVRITTLAGTVVAIEEQYRP